jgi:hypothetical protein
VNLKVICRQFMLYRVVESKVDGGVSLCRFPVYVH